MEFKDLSQKQIDDQENLTKNRFKILTPKCEWESVQDKRPKEHLIELMNWSKSKFKEELAVRKNLNCYIHNKIVIDGSFLQFCEEQSVNVTCIMKESIASWNSENDNEHFSTQGVFKIKKNKLEFLHCALFHKGNQNEDEIAFFVVVDDSNFYEYVALRNQYDKWMIDRDREHLQVQVIGGDGFSYTRNSSWDDLFLPTILKHSIKSAVESFIGAEEIYKASNIAWKRGMLLYGDPGTGKSSTIKTIISNYDFKPVTVQTGSDTNDSVLSEAFAYCQEQSPGLLYIEDLDTLLGNYVSVSHFLNLMDGVSSNNGILIIATANDISILKESVTNRPSRFDRKFYFPKPNHEMTQQYLEKWFGKSLNKKDYTKLVNKSVENNLTYAYLKELYLTSVFNAMAEDREKPILKDILSAMEQISSDKQTADNNFDYDDNNGTRTIGV